MQLLCKQLQTEFIYNCNNELFCSIFPKLKCKYVKCRAQMCLFPFSVINLRGFGFFHNIEVCPNSSLCNLSELCFAIKASQVIFLWNGNTPWFCPPMRMKMFSFVSSIRAQLFLSHTSLQSTCSDMFVPKKINIVFKLFIFFLLLSFFFLIWCTGKSFCSQGGTVCPNAIISFLLSISHKVVLNKMIQNDTFYLCALF